MESVDLQVIRKFSSFYDSAKSRGLEFNLSLLSVKNLLIAKKCYYTGKKLSNNPKSKNYRSVDRIDNSKGYIKGNVCACTVDINVKKKDLSFEEIETIYKKIKRMK